MPWRADDGEFRDEGIGKVTVSIGVTMFGVGDSLDGAFDRADKALYSAKRQGRTAWFSAESQNDRAHRPANLRV